MKAAQGESAVPPPGTILVKAAQGGYAVPPRRFALHFGRATLDVHVPVGTGDRYISRLHGVFTCDGTQWRLRNEGFRPIQILGEEPLLRGHEIVVAAGYTPLTIKTPHPRSHWVEVYVVGFPSTADGADSEATTVRPVAYELSPVERLVITALAQDYLRRDPDPRPASWGRVADALSRADPQRQWNARNAEYIVARVRKRLSEGPHPIPGLLDDGGKSSGNMLSHNLIEALLLDATLLPEDLHLLKEDRGRE